MNKTYITAKDVAKQIHFNEDVVRKWAREGKIPAIKLGEEWRFDQDAITEWLNKGNKGE